MRLISRATTGPLLLLALAVQAQETVLQDVNPPGLKWYQVNTPGFRVLYPEGFALQAQRMANTLETIRLPESRSMGSAPRRMTVLLQNQSSLSNGFVTMAPRRSEFFTMPAQDYNFMGTNDWLNMLAVHEYRHMSQFQTSIRGFNRLLYYVFGQQALAGMSFVAAPQWLWEGDAVATETAFTRSGRGRIPQFGMTFRTNLLEGRTFSYNKQYLTSFKNYMPNHYVLGFHLVSYVRKRSGDADIWGKISRRSWSVPFIPFAFSNAVKKETGKRLPALYKEMAASLRQSWSEEISKLTLTPYTAVTQRDNERYTDYSYPQPQEDGSVIAMKSGIGDIEQLVWLRDGQEVHRFAVGPLNRSGMLSASPYGRVVWNEYRYHPRYQVKTYSVVTGYERDRPYPKEVSVRSRYAGAAISPDGYKVVTVETDTSYQTRLVVLDYFSGKVLNTFQNPAQALLSMPRWSADGKTIVVLHTTAAGKSVVTYSLGSGAMEQVLPSSDENIGYPVLIDHYLLYNSPYSGIDNIYAADLQSGKRYQVTSSKYGAFHPARSFDGATLYYSEQGRNGLDIVKTPFDPSKWVPLESVQRATFNLADHLAEQEGQSNLLSTVPQTQWPVKKYNRMLGMFNPHSWGPYTDYSLSSFFVGLSSQNLLSTTQLSGGYTFDLNERTGSYGANLSYQGILPVIDLAVRQSNRSVNEGDITYAKVVGADTTQVTENLKFKWDEKTVETGLKIPLNLTRSRFQTGLTLGNLVGITQTTHFTNSIDGGGRLLPANYPQFFFRNYTDKGTLVYNHLYLEAYRVLKRSHRDINSRWGQLLYVDVFSTPYGGDYTGNQFSLYGVAYFPGFFRHHSLWGYWAYQYSQIESVVLKSGQGLDNYLFRNQIPLVRGQSVSRAQQFYSMSANYTFPVWYPDVAVGPLLNIQRVRANAFFDYGFGASTYGTRNYSDVYTSVGGEVKFDINVMRFLPKLDVGFRYSYGLQPANTRFEILLGTLNFY